MRTIYLPAIIIGLLVGSLSQAGEADVEAVKVFREPSGAYRFTVTIRHDDEGWNHYANEWQVSGPDGVVYGARTLYHPHVNEQPFTRNLSGVRIPEGIEEVTIRGGDSVHGYGGKTVTVRLPCIIRDSPGNR